MDILIKNGTIVRSTGKFVSDLLISNGKIAKIAANIDSETSDTKIINAEGKYIFPGGIDPHVHMHLPTPAGYSADDFETGSIAALWGGTTTLLDFVTPNKGQTLTDALNKRIEEAQNALCDYSLHVSPVEWTKTTEEELQSCKNEGIKSFKVYMAYKNSIGLENADIEKVMQAVSKLGGLVTLHCEIGDEIEELRQKAFDNGQIEPKYHPATRPAHTEANAVKEAIELGKSTGCPIYIVHTSAEESLKYISEAQNAGQTVISESCPHYLLLDDSMLDTDFESAAPFMMSPPLRKKSDQEALWEAIKSGVVTTIGTDHCPFNMAQKAAGKTDFRKTANGTGGVEHRLSLLYTYGVLENRISLEQFVDISSTQAAKTFGLYPQKGEIAVGSDADILVWNPETKHEISVKNHHQNTDNNPFEGFKTKGIPEIVISNGQIAIENNQFHKKNLKGKFLRR